MRNGLLTLHILTAIVIVGWLAMQAMLLPRVLRQGPSQVEVVRFSSRASELLGKLAIIVFLLGVALAARIGGEIWSQPWLNASMTLFILALVNGGLFIARTEKAALAKFESNQPADAEAKRIAMLGGINNLILLVIVYLMVAKPGA